MEKVVIIGSGPAGFTASIYTSRAMLNPLLIEGYKSGGQLMMTTDVENFPGFPKGVMGPDLMQNMREQSLRFDTRIMSKNVTKVDFSTKPLKVFVGEEEIETESVIICTGAKPKLLGLENEMRLMGKGVSTCATCDGAFFRDQELVMVGGGDSAMEEAIFLTRFASKVTVVHRREEFRASKIMLEKARANPKIAWKLNAVIEDIQGENEVEGVVLKDTKTGEHSDLSCQGVFIAIGHTPNAQLFEGQLETDSQGYLLKKTGTQTNIEGVFVAGDVSDHVYRQAITAAGMGCQAALDCERYLQSKE